MPVDRPILKNLESALELDTTASRTSDISDDSFSHTHSVDGIKKKKPLHVKFNSIQIRNYDITLGDNPSCNYGPPVTLDWNYDEMEPISVDAYEEGRGRPPRKMHQLHMLSRQRANLLKITAGVTDDEITAAMDEMRKIQKERNMTKMGSPLLKLQEVAESAGRKFQRSRSFARTCAWKQQVDL